VGKKHRDRYEIVASILEFAHGEERVGITKLMYFSFLPYHSVKLYLDILTKEGLLERDKLDKYYKITRKGQRTLAIFNEMNEMLKPEKSD